MSLFAGFDVSTQGCKLVVIDAGAGEVVHQDAVVYDRDLPHYDTLNGVIRDLPPGVSESDPRMWIEAVELLLGRLSLGVDPGKLRAISVAGQMHGLVALAANGALARSRSKLWNDFSTQPECGILTDLAGGPASMIVAVGNSQRTGYTAPKIVHMIRHEPEAYARTATFLVVHNWVNWHLTGGKESGVAVMEPGDAAGTALWSPATGQWAEALIKAIDPTLRRRLPPVRPADRTIGTVGVDLAARHGLDPACRVDAGSGDNMYGALGTGNFEPGMLTVSLGTSGTAATIFAEPWIDPTGEIACYGDPTGHFLSLLCVSNMANAYNAVRRRFDMDHDAFDAAAASAPPGNDGRLLVPWIDGERTPDLPLATPIAFGIRLEDDGPAALCRAAVEGGVLNLHAGSTRLPVKASEIRLTGGLAASPTWRQTIADVFEMETVPVAGEGAALGAAIHAAWVWARESGREVALADLVDVFVRPDESMRARPRREAVATHRIQKRLFAALTSRVRGLEGEDPFELRAKLRRRGRRG